MAILDQPLFSEEATGSIRSTISFFTRGERLCIIPKLSYRQNPTPARQAVKDQWRAGILAWHALSPTTQLSWGQNATGLQTGFNAFMEEFMSPTPCPPQWFEEDIFDRLISPSSAFAGQTQPKDPFEWFTEVTGGETKQTNNPTTQFSYSIP